MKKLISLGLLSAAVSLPGFAHEGHGHTHGFTITHYLIEPVHLAVLLGALTASVLFFRRYFKKIRKT